MALGSSQRNIFRLFLGEALIISISGVGLGAVLILGAWPVINRVMNTDSLSPLFLNTSAHFPGKTILTNEEGEIELAEPPQVDKTITRVVREGSLYEQNDFFTEVRSRIDTFAVIISLLGFVLLAAASIGIL